MKLQRKLFAALLTLISIISFGTMNVNAAPQSVTLKPKSSMYYFSEAYGTDYINGYNFYRKELTDGRFVYCVSNINTSAPGGLTVNLVGEITDAGLDYIIRNGYPNKSYTGNELKDYYLTQAAIWLYFDQTRGSNNWKGLNFNDPNNAIKSYVYDLVEAAKKASKPSAPSIKTTIESNDLTLASDAKNYVSKDIKVKLNGTTGTYEVSLKNAPANTYLMSTTGEVKTKFKSGESFNVYVPASSIKETGSLQLVFAATAVMTKTYEYTSGLSGYQNIGLIVSEDSEIKDSLTLKYAQVPTKLKISKQDITSKKELPGATLVLTDSNGKEIETWVSTNEPHYIEGLEEGKYKLTETIAPKGYVLSSETIEFTLEANGKVKTVTMYNTHEVTKLKISKQDITSKKELPGATLVLKDSKGKEIETWVSTNEPHYIEGLEEGKYTLTETIAPDGYVLSSETIEFTLEANGKVKTVTMYNTHESTMLKISKQDITSKEELPGATLVLKDSKGNVIETWVSTDEPHYIEGLDEGKYTLTETIAPDGYVLSSETIEFTLEANGKVKTVVMYNDKYDVPITDSNVSNMTIIASSMLILLGAGMVFYVKKQSL